MSEALSDCGKLPRALVNPEFLVPAVRNHAGTRRGMAMIGCVLAAPLAAGRES